MNYIKGNLRQFFFEQSFEFDNFFSDPEFLSKYKPGSKQHPVLFQRLKTKSSTASSRPDTFASKHPIPGGWKTLLAAALLEDRPII